MEFRHLMYFVTLVEEGSFAEASKKLHITQPALSKTIKLLEDEAGGKLIERSLTNRELTELGVFLYPRAKDLIKQFECMIDDFHSYKKEASGILHIGLPPLIGSLAASALIESFMKRYPKVRIIREEDGDKALLKRVARNGLELTFTTGYDKEMSIEQTLLYSEGLDVVLNVSNTLCKQAKLTINKLQKEKFVLFDDTSFLRDLVISECMANCFLPNIVTDSGYWDYIMELVSCNNYISILPHGLTKKYKSEKVIAIPLHSPAMKWNVSIVNDKKANLSPAARAFRDYAISYFNEKASDLCVANK